MATAMEFQSDEDKRAAYCGCIKGLDGARIESFILRPEDFDSLANKRSSEGLVVETVPARHERAVVAHAGLSSASRQIKALIMLVSTSYQMPRPYHVY